MRYVKRRDEEEREGEGVGAGVEEGGSALDDEHARRLPVADEFCRSTVMVADTGQ